MLKKFHLKDSPIDLGELKKVKTFRDFDNLVTAPLHQFENADDYYSQSSCRQFLHKIKKPTLIIHAINDPFMTPEVIPPPSELSENVTIELTRSGGHVGFISGLIPGRAKYWLESRIPAYINQTLS